VSLEYAAASLYISKPMRAVLLAAGRGTRMGHLTATTPKPLLTVGGKPILGHILEGVAGAGVREFVVVTGYLGERIEQAFGDGHDLGVSISYRRQDLPNGTAGALLLARDLIADGPFLLSWGDILVDPELYRTLVERFRAAPCDVLLGVNRVDDPWRGAAVYIGAGERVERIVEKPPRRTSTTPWNNAGIFVFSPLVLDYAARLEPSARGEYELPQAISRMVEDGRDVRALPVGDFWSDVGTPEDLRAVDSAWRRRRLLAEFSRRHGAPADVVVSAPGRVNLIGEHTDYNGLPVLPIAIDRTIRIAARRGVDSGVTLDNADPRFGERLYEVGADIAPFGDGDWGNYHKAAVQGLVRHLGPRGIDWRGGAFLVDGDVPSGAGLSSSSAFVVASALAFLALNEIAVPREELADVLARAERYVGTLSGGMDQAASLLARADHALRIDFGPLRVRHVPLPPGLAIVVCHSLVRAEKAAGAREAYNTRVIECRLATAAMERALPLPGPLRRLGDLAEQFPGRPLASFLEPLAAILPEGDLRLDDVARAIGADPVELERRCEVPRGIPDRFAVLARARHVLTEADRVAAAVEALSAGALDVLGALMTASHASCRDDYAVSCPELDELVEIALSSGALGARLTGAGFGGCTVNAVPVADVESFLRQVDRRFYARRCEQPEDHRFVFAAREGATVESRSGAAPRVGRR
jgi:N-acetylgalactosamine kinase